MRYELTNNANSISLWCRFGFIERNAFSHGFGNLLELALFYFLLSFLVHLNHAKPFFRFLVQLHNNPTKIVNLRLHFLSSRA